MGKKRNKKAPQPSPSAPAAPPVADSNSWPRVLVENLLILAVLAHAYWLQGWSTDLYYRSVQEDEYLEWATFWAFMGAAVLAWVLARRQRRSGIQAPWFLVGLGLFCFFVAMEEISWGQRVFAYRPPAYFLEHNFQQELNIHNVVSTSWRKLSLMGVILGYGVVLPLLPVLVPPLRRLATRLGVVIPPLGLAPAFLVTYLTYQNYPWKFTGEVVELMLGLGFLFALLEGSLGPGTREQWPRTRSTWVLTAVPWVAVMVLGVATAGISRMVWKARPEIVEATRAESEALARDFLFRARQRCGLHKRVYSFVEKYDQRGLFDGDFAALTAQGLAEERAEFFLDPWNSPYWIRYKCEKRPRVVRAFVYSFGPNRRRDSSSWEIRGDDVGTVFRSEGELRADDAEEAEDTR